MSHFSGDVEGEVQIGLLGNKSSLRYVILTSAVLTFWTNKPIKDYIK